MSFGKQNSFYDKYLPQERNYNREWKEYKYADVQGSLFGIAVQNMMSDCTHYAILWDIQNFTRHFDFILQKKVL